MTTEPTPPFTPAELLHVEACSLLPELTKQRHAANVATLRVREIEQRLAAIDRELAAVRPLKGIIRDLRG